MSVLSPAGYARHPSDVLCLVLGVLVLLATARAIHQHSIGTRETDVFRVINDLALPGWTDPGIWLVMQLGVIGAVPAVAAVALATRRLRLALDFAVAGGAIYLVAKLVKEFVQRGRPQTLLDGVHILGEPARGLGYVSGHSAVAVALATVASPYLGRRARRVVWVAALLVPLSRVYVGAHLPFDVLGGAALGWSAGALVHLLLGRPTGQPSPAGIRRALEAHGLGPVTLEPVGTDQRRAASFTATTAAGDAFVKVVPRERPDDDLLWRAWRVLRRRPPQPGRSGPPLQQVEHEASMALLAAAAGVRAPVVLLVGSFGNGAGLLVQRRVDGRNLADLGPVGDDALLAEICRQVGLLHRARIAHGDLAPPASWSTGSGGLAGRLRPRPGRRRRPGAGRRRRRAAVLPGGGGRPAPRPAGRAAGSRARGRGRRRDLSDQVG